MCCNCCKKHDPDTGSKYLYHYEKDNEQVFIYEKKEDAKEGWIRVWYRNLSCKCNFCLSDLNNQGHYSWMPEILWNRFTTKIEE